MARHFVRLKLALLAASLRASRRQRVGFVLGVLLALPVAAWGFVGLSAAGRAEHGDSILVIVFVLLFAAWLVLPILAFASDETLDPVRLELLPLTRGRLLVGLFAASLVGVAPAMTLVALTGTVHGFAPRGPGALLVVVAVLVELALCVVGSRALVTALSGLLRSRRGRDFLVALSALVGVGIAIVWNAAAHFLDDVEPERVSSALTRVADAVGWLPPGLAARAVADARAGDLGTAAYELALAAAAVAALAWAWGAAVGRALTTAPTTSRRRAGAGARRETELFPRLAAFLPHDRCGAVAAKDMRYWARDPRLRTAWLVTALFGVALVVLVALSRSARQPEIVLAAVTVLWLTSFQAFNQFGGDGPAAWMNVAATGRPRDDLLGKNLALALVTLSFVGLVAITLAALTGGWLYLPATAGLAVAVVGAILAVGNVVSVRLPLPVQRSRTNLWGAPGGAGGALFALLVQILGLTVLGMLVLPIVVGVAIGGRFGAAGLAVAVVLAAAYGLGLWRVGLLVADERLAGGEPDLLAALEAGRR